MVGKAGVKVVKKLEVRVKIEKRIGWFEGKW